jgi:hypothetical protein
MKAGYLTFATIVLALTAGSLLAPSNLIAQTLFNNDAFDVTLSHTVTVGSKTLPPGNYRMEPLNLGGGDAPVLVIRQENGPRVEISAEVAPIADTRPRPDTLVLYRRVGDKYYFDRIWVKGLTYGYKFPPPKNAKSHGGQQ